MPGKVTPIPQGYHTATPYLSVNDGPRAIEFYKKAFGAQEIMRMEAGPGNHGENGPAAAEEDGGLGIYGGADDRFLSSALRHVHPFTIVPPLGCSTWPVMYDESFEARNT